MIASPANTARCGRPRATGAPKTPGCRRLSAGRPCRHTYRPADCMYFERSVDDFPGPPPGRGSTRQPSILHVAKQNRHDPPFAFDAAVGAKAQTRLHFVRYVRVERGRLTLHRRHLWITGVPVRLRPQLLQNFARRADRATRGTSCGQSCRSCCRILRPQDWSPSSTDLAIASQR